MHPTPPQSSSPHKMPKESYCHGRGHNAKSPSGGSTDDRWKVTFACQLLSPAGPPALLGPPALHLFAFSVMPHIGACC